ncbi:MAG: serine/threonine-protein kinase RsbW [Cryomorphaceae bacterium]|jgi:serine/threonine-protein kinase RsbW
MTITESAKMETIEFASKGENITVIECLVDDLCEKHRIQEEHYGNILIALTEAVNNAIYHGNKQDPDKKVIVKYHADEDEFRFIIEDEGPGFDFENVPDPTSPENIEKPNGRGVFLMRHLSDEIGFDDDGRIVQLAFKSLSKPVSVNA